MKTQQVTGEASLATDRIHYEDGQEDRRKMAIAVIGVPPLCTLVLMPGTYYYQDKNNVNGYITIKSKSIICDT